MAAINFPDAPTNGQIFESGGMSWTYVAGIGWTLNSAIVEAGSGFTFIADTMPLPVNVGDTWFDSSTGASGGTSWVAVEEGPAGVSEKVWVQFAPGVAGPPVPTVPVIYGTPGVAGDLAGAGTYMTINIPAAPYARLADITYQCYFSGSTGAPDFIIKYDGIQNQSWRIGSINGMCSMRSFAALGPNVTHTVTMNWGGAGSCHVYADSMLHQFFCSVVPYQ